MRQGDGLCLCLRHLASLVNPDDSHRPSAYSALFTSSACRFSRRSVRSELNIILHTSYMHTFKVIQREFHKTYSNCQDWLSLSMKVNLAVIFLDLVTFEFHYRISKQAFECKRLKL